MGRAWDFVDRRGASAGLVTPERVSLRRLPLRSREILGTGDAAQVVANREGALAAGVVEVEAREEAAAIADRLSATQSVALTLLCQTPEPIDSTALKV